MTEILGTWKLEQYLVTDDATGGVTKPFGNQPNGVLSFTPDARMYAFLVPEDRQPPAGPMPNDEECVRLQRSMVAYAGSYTVAGDEVSVLVDISWSQSWTGMTQVRHVKVDGDRLVLSFRASLPGGSQPSLFELIWSRVTQP